MRLKVVDEVVEEPLGGAHRSPDEMVETLKERFVATLDDLERIPVEDLIDQRYARLRVLGDLS